MKTQEKKSRGSRNQGRISPLQPKGIRATIAESEEKIRRFLERYDRDFRRADRNRHS